MISTFFIIVLEQTRNIGILKTIGLNHKSVMKLFVVIASRLIFRGLYLGNIAALAIGLLQSVFHLIPLDPETYYVSYIPIEINPMMFLWLNLLVFTTCLLTLLLPAHYISKRISPIEAVRYE
jgi:lipoprotein-releasing system permease protein